MKEGRCSECNGTGYYGDNGYGILGNSEYCVCDCEASCLENRVKYTERAISRLQGKLALLKQKFDKLMGISLIL